MAPELGSHHLNDVRTFVVAAAEGKLVAAGRRLGVPTSTISRSLSRLEHQLGVLLLKRGPRGLQLTEKGERYLGVCREALRTLADEEAVLRGDQEQPNGLLKIACPVTMARQIFGPLLKEFLGRYSGMRVALETYSSDWDQEPRQDIDVFFKMRAPRESRRRVRAYHGVYRALFASENYLQAAGVPEEPEDLEHHRCIGLTDWNLSSELGSITLSPVFVVRTDDPFLHYDLVSQGMGIAVLPTYMEAWPPRKLRRVLPKWKATSLPLYALSSGPKHQTPQTRVLLDFLGEYLGQPADPRLQGADPKQHFSPPGELHHSQK
jgi:LysR family transcriptional regulator, transcriptional activator for dmlA